MSKLRNMAPNVALIFGSLVFCFIAAELLFRALLFVDGMPSFGLREPWRYADPYVDDDYWKLTYLWGSTSHGQAVGIVDEELGWNAPITADDPLGIYATEPYTPADFENPVLFYGDSFVGGWDNIPQKLDGKLPGRPVVNLGVGGFGVDQTYLKFTKTVELFEDPLALFGVLTYDLDRSVLAIRTHQKPYFLLEDGGLVLQNTPVLATTSEYIDRNPVEIRSYFLRFVLFRLRTLIPPENFDSLLAYAEKNEAKRVVNRAILKAFKQQTDALGIEGRVVLFYAGEEIGNPTWREDFLKSTLADLGIEYFDTRRYLLDYMKVTGVALDELYRDDLGHLDEKGRNVIAGGLAAWIRAAEDEI